MLAIGCGGGGNAADEILDDLDPAPLPDDAVVARRWAGLASAPVVFATAQAPTSIADISLSNGSSCPVKTGSETESTYEGGCTDDDGRTWRGRAVVTVGRITYEGFGWSGLEDCNGQSVMQDLTFDGEFSGAFAGPGSATAFEIDLRFVGLAFDDDTCAQRDADGAISYRGEVRFSEAEDVWNGSGRVGTSTDGLAEVETRDEAIDSEVCGDEAIGGETTVQASGHTIVIRYDGATDCDPESTVQWSYDGAERGELTDVACASSRPSTFGLVFAVVGLLVYRRRRTRV